MYHHHHVDMLCYYKTLRRKTCLLIPQLLCMASCSGHICKQIYLDTLSLLYHMVYTHVAADWADIADTPTKQEKRPRLCMKPWFPEGTRRCVERWGNVFSNAML